MHAPFAPALFVVERQHFAERRPVAALPQLDYLAVHLLEKWTPDLVHELLGRAVVREVVAKRSAREDGDGPVVAFLYGPAHREAETRAGSEVMPHAPAGSRDGLEMLVGVHVAHGDQRAVFELERGVAMGPALHAHFVGHLRNKMADARVARVGVGHVLNEVGQFVAGVDAFEARVAVDVIFAVHEPVNVEYHDGVDPQFTATPANLMMPVDSALTASFMRAVEFRKI